MRETGKQRPLVRSSLISPDHDDDRIRREAKGAKNTCDRPGRHGQTNKAKKRTMYIATYNVRTLSTQEKIEELQNEIQNIKWDIIGLGEVRRTGEHLTKLNSEHILYSKGKAETKTNGVGFLIHKDLAKNVIDYEGISDRIAQITITLNKREKLKVVQVYAPTSKSEEEDVESFYEELTECLQKNKTTYSLIIGDFNAKVGKKLEATENSIGPHGIDCRNPRGDMLVNFAESNNLYIMNTFFKKRKQRKWTWRSPDHKTKNEIDFIISNQRNIIQDVSVLSKCTVGSDHRMVRAKMYINLQSVRAKKFKNKRKSIDANKLIENKLFFQEELTKRLTPEKTDETQDINKLNEHISSAITEAALKAVPRTPSKNTKISQATENLIKKRRSFKIENDLNKIEFAELNKLIKKEIRKDIRKFKMKTILETLEENKGPRALKKRLGIGQAGIVKIKNKENETLTRRVNIKNEIERYYTELYQSKIDPDERQVAVSKRKILNVGSEEVPDITTDEIKNALRKMKNNRSPGPDNIIAEMLKEGGENLYRQIAKIFNKCLETQEIPKSWQTAEVIIIHKKGDIADLNNYRPISLLSQLYKLFIRIITNRLTAKLDGNQPIEQAGFRSGYNTCDHLQTMQNLLEKSKEYNIHLYIAFIDYEKAFDSVEIWAILNSLVNCGIDSRYNRLIKNIYSGATMYIKTDPTTTTDNIPIHRGVRQGDVISPKLFTSVLQDVFRQMDWSDKGINIDGVNLNHLRFADDIVILSTDHRELQEMINELNNYSKEVGLRMNKTKTKIMTNASRNINITLEDTPLEIVDKYTYLGQQISTANENMSEEITRRIRIGWTTFGKLSYILKDKEVPNHLKAKVYDQCVTPAITYGCETWRLTKKNAQRLEKAQRAHERQMLGIKLIDKKRNTWIRKQTKVKDIIERIAQLKWQWAGHLARRQDNRWAKSTLQWRPRSYKRGKGRPSVRWRDDIQDVAGTQWMTLAMDRERWEILGKAYVQQWMERGSS